MHNSFIGDSISEKISPDYLSHLLGALFDAALDEAGWVKCLEAIRVTFSGNYASLIVRKETADDVGLIVSVGDN